MSRSNTLLATILIAPIASVALASVALAATGGTLGTVLGGTVPMSSSWTALVEQDPGRGIGRDRPTDRGERVDPRRDPAREREIEEARWLDRLPREDRGALEVLVGFESPALADDLTWFNAEKATLESMRGKVVVIQSFTTRATRSTPQRLEASLGERRERGLVILALHTPENADRAPAMIEQLDTQIPILLDASGTTSDRFGMFRRPVNVVIDRTGNIRYAGLNDRGLDQAVDRLLAETHDPDAKPRQREEAEAFEVRWPTFTTPVGRATDLRGRQSPPFHVESWIKGGGEPDGRLTIVDFWATWCGPCRAAIPHMNELTQHYGNRVFVVGLSNEQRSAFNDGNLANRRLRLSQFAYNLAIDPSAQMQRAFGVQSIPHIAVISSDGIVRWQGHPNNLNREVLDQLVTANEQLRNVGADAPTEPPARWAHQSRTTRS